MAKLMEDLPPMMPTESRDMSCTTVYVCALHAAYVVLLLTWQNLTNCSFSVFIYLFIYFWHCLAVSYIGLYNT